jgi:hypothetical protein
LHTGHRRGVFFCFLKKTRAGCRVFSEIDALVDEAGLFDSNRKYKSGRVTDKKRRIEHEYESNYVQQRSTQ